MSATRHHYNSRSRRDNIKRKQKNREEKFRKENKHKEICDDKNKKKQKEIEKRERKNKSIKTPKIKVHELMNFTSYKDIGLRVPIKFTLFGKLKSESRKLVSNLLDKNRELILNNILELEYIDYGTYSEDKNDERYEKKIKFFLDNFCKRSYLKKFLRSNSCIYDSFFLDKYKKDYYLCFDLSTIFMKTRERLIIKNCELINYIEMKTHVYNNINLQKYKFKNKELNKDGMRFEFFNMTLKNTYYKISNSMIVPEFSKMVPCIYRFYFKGSSNIDMNEGPRFSLNNKSLIHCQKLIENPPTNIKLFAIPNILRYCHK